MKHRAKIGTCSGAGEVALVHSLFDAHELPVVINGEMHAAVMGGLGGFIPLNILVDRQDAEDAAALLRDARAGEHAVSEDGALPEVAEDDELRDGPTSDERADAEGVWEAKPAAGAAEAQPAAAAAAPAAATTTAFDTRRRRTGAALLLSVIPGFGAAHMSTGAWGRGIAIAVLNVIGVASLLSGSRLFGGWLLFGARFGDLFGALWRVWSTPGGERKEA